MKAAPKDKKTNKLELVSKIVGYKIHRITPKERLLSIVKRWNDFEYMFIDDEIIKEAKNIKKEINSIVLNNPELNKFVLLKNYELI